MKKEVKVIAAIMLITVAFFAIGFKSEYNLDNEGGNGGGNTYNGHEYVDLGLPSGTLWATCNVGATTPEGYGDYFAWGETRPKSTYNWSTYKYSSNGNYCLLTKYSNGNSYGGFTDNLTTLQPDDDAATANWGNGWCTPTEAQWKELFEDNENTVHHWITQNGVRGMKFTSKSNGNSLFLPAAGYYRDDELKNAGSQAKYWSSSLGIDDPCCAWYFDEELMTLYYRYIGWPVRAVRSSPQKNDPDDVGKNDKGNTHPTEQGEVFQIVEEMPEFPGGTSELSLFLENNLNYPSKARENNVQGRVFVNFIVEPDGHLSNVKVMRSLRSGCDEEAIRLVKSMPNWKPGRQGGAVVRVSYILPINFKLK